MSEFKPDCDSADPLSRLPAEHQLALLRTVVDGSMDAIIVHEADGTVVFHSRGLCRMLGMTPEEMAGLQPFGWVPAEAIRGASDRLEAILHGGRLTFRSSIRRHDGVVIPTEVIAQRLDSEVGPLIVATIRDVSEQLDAEERLRYLAYHDTLTGLASRIAFTERLEQAIAESKRHGDVIMIAYIDLDHFKPINDRFGHGAGDEVLVEIGRRIEAAVRTQDLVARIGGDEFVVLFSRPSSVGEVPVIAERLLATIREPIVIAGMDNVVEASIGLAVFDPANDDERSLVVKADVAMYAAKADPQHPWLLYDPSMG